MFKHVLKPLLGLVAAAFYVGFIVLTYFRSQH